MPRPSNADLQRRNARSKRKIEDPTYKPVTTRSRPNPPPNSLSVPSHEHWMEMDDNGMMEDEEGESDSEIEMSDNEGMDLSLDLAGTAEEFDSAFEVLMDHAKRYFIIRYFFSFTLFLHI